MGGINVDSGWITGYAGTVAAAADELASARGALADGRLSADAFGDLGRAVRATAAYAGAAGGLGDRLDRAVESLRSAVDGLHEVAGRHSSQDEENAAAFRQIDRG